jgi:lysophospholipase L1-like esterase
VAQLLTRSAEDGLAYVALGDSYTIGTSVGETERWPNQLVARLPATSLRLTANLAVNGFTSLDVIGDELPAVASLQPGFVSLLVGVNDIVQGIPAETFRSNVTTIVDVLLGHVDRRRIVVVSIPDYTLTPEGAAYGDPADRRRAIVDFNGIFAELARERDVAFVDIFELSQRVRDDPSLVATDGLHPSGAQYRLWVDRIAPVVEALLSR